MNVGEERPAWRISSFLPPEKLPVEAWSSHTPPFIEKLEALIESEARGDVNLIDDGCRPVACRLESLGECRQIRSKDLASHTVLPGQGDLIQTVLTRVDRRKQRGDGRLGPGRVGEGPTEIDALGRQFVDMGSRRQRVTVDTQPIRPQGIDHENQNIRLRRRSLRRVRALWHPHDIERPKTIKPDQRIMAEEYQRIERFDLHHR